MANIDYNLKAQIIECGLAKLQSVYSKLIFLWEKCYHNPDFSYMGLTNEASMDLLNTRIQDVYWEAIDRFQVDLETYTDPLVREALKINRASYQRVKRLKAKMKKLLKKPCLFLTLTFKNEYYETTSDLTKRKYVQRCLKSLGVSYVANVDYGKKNQRLHYHAVVQIDRIDPKVWEYGNLDIKSIRNPNEIAISKYLDKLTNHAIKETAQGNRLLYSKKF